MFRNLRAGENLHIVFWLFKDLCWVMGFKAIGTAMIAPTLLMAIWIAWRSRSDRDEFWHALAVVFWICANGIWMLGEFFCDDCTRPYARVFFGLGLLSCAVHYLWVRPFWRKGATLAGATHR